MNATRGHLGVCAEVKISTYTLLHVHVHLEFLFYSFDLSPKG